MVDEAKVKKFDASQMDGITEKDVAEKGMVLTDLRLNDGQLLIVMRALQGYFRQVVGFSMKAHGIPKTLKMAAEFDKVFAETHNRSLKFVDQEIEEMRKIDPAGAAQLESRIKATGAKPMKEPEADRVNDMLQMFEKITDPFGDMAKNLTQVDELGEKKIIH